MREESKLDSECIGNACPIMQDSGRCPYYLDLGGTSYCMIAHENRVHSYVEIGRIMGISAQHVVYLEKKALKKLKKALKDSGEGEDDIFGES